MDAELNEEIVQLAKIGRVPVRVEHGELGHRIPHKNCHYIIPLPRPQSPNLRPSRFVTPIISHITPVPSPASAATNPYEGGSGGKKANFAAIVEVIAPIFHLEIPAAAISIAIPPSQNLRKPQNQTRVRAPFLPISSRRSR
ncbi:hypothetical protein KSP40_PGU017994 [Platanthera guangdongensis]|uniref:Uncharacterized protein n=1 Tax=Platanthera guangdongensis TaxID=2320717 RepID=A0ABR2LTN4_9ASPA